MAYVLPGTDEGDEDIMGIATQPESTRVPAVQVKLHRVSSIIHP